MQIQTIGSGLQIDNVDIYSPNPVSVKDKNSNEITIEF